MYRCDFFSRTLVCNGVQTYLDSSINFITKSNYHRERDKNHLSTPSACSHRRSLTVSQDMCFSGLFIAMIAYNPNNLFENPDWYI
jgi:hypothetical protein